MLPKVQKVYDMLPKVQCTKSSNDLSLLTFKPKNWSELILPIYPNGT